MQKDNKIKLSDKTWLFWDRFCWLTDLDYISRSGLVLLGYFNDVPSIIPVKDRPESVGEHIRGVISMTFLFQCIFKVGSDSEDEAKYQYDTELLHEVGERVITDIPDDGSRNMEEKDKIELGLMREFASGLVAPAEARIVSDFMNFQKCDSFAFLMDKFHFVMKQLYLCSKGLVGYMSEKYAKGLLSRQDEVFMDLTDSDLAVINTAAHFLCRTRGIPGREYCIEVMEEGFLQVFGAVPAALEQFY